MSFSNGKIMEVTYHILSYTNKDYSMTGIIHADRLSLNALADTVKEQSSILDDHNATSEQYEEAYEILGDVSRFLSELGRDLLHAVPTQPMSRVFLDDWIDDLVNHLETIAREEPEAISEKAFEDEMQQLVIDCYPEVDALPAFIVIDWEQTTHNMKEDYTEATLENRVYYIRLD